MKCEKCGYESEENTKLKDVFLCQICKKFAPQDSQLNEYLQEKINWRELESFRKFHTLNDNQKQGMQEKAKQGNPMSRPALGYNILDKQLVPDPEKSLRVQEIFQTFLDQDISLNQISNKFSVSVNGLKKILRNFTYIGKVKFAGQISQGTHQQIISPDLFNKVQKKLEDLGIN